MATWRARRPHRPGAASILPALLLGLLAACESEPPAAPQAEGGLADDVQRIFNVACVSCHLHGQAIGSLDLGPDAAWADLVGVPSEQAPMLRVQPGEPGRSYLMHKLEGTHREVGGVGERMPMSRRLTDAQIGRVRDWIERGAPP